MANDNNLPGSILIIDDDSTVGQAIAGPLAGYKVQVENAQDLDTAIYQFNNGDFGAVFIELDFDPLHGLALIQKLRKSNDINKRSTPFIIMSGKTRPKTDDNLIKELLDIEIIVKPFTLVTILPFLSRSMAARIEATKIERIRTEAFETLEANDLEKALAVANKAIALSEPRGKIITFELFDQAKEYKKGLEAAKEAFKKSPLINYTSWKGHFLCKLNEHKAAAAPLEEAYESSPHHIRRLENMVETYLQLDEPEKAYTKMMELIEVCPESEDMRFDLMAKLQDSDNLELARKLCKATTKPMDVIRYYNNLGVQCSKEGNHNEAIEAYRRALVFIPKFKENYRIHYNIALALTKSKNRSAYQEAVVSLSECLKLKPDFDKAKNTLESINKALNKKKAS